MLPSIMKYLDLLSIRLVNDMYDESRNDDVKYRKIAFISASIGPVLIATDMEKIYKSCL